MRRDIEPRLFQSRTSIINDLDKQKRERAEKKSNDRLEKIISFATALVATTGIVISIYTLRATQGQLKEAQVADRPWIKASVTMRGQIDFTSRQPRMYINVQMTNVGHLPAFYVEPAAWHLIGLTTPSDSLEDQFPRCQHYWPDIDSEDSNGLVLFPGDSVDSSRYLYVTPLEIKRALRANSGKNYISLYIVGCVKYTDESSSKPHYSEIVYSVTNAADANNVPQVPPSIIPSGTIPVNSVELKIYPIEGSHAT